ncbi:MAG: glycosyltransferase [Bacteroidetes bacterium]|nr:glycosyltransferase [Bacteroidota bacterium]
MSQISKISIVTPSLNQAGFIERTIRSVLTQKVDAVVEYIVVDGGSTDGTMKILERFRSLISFTSEPDNGMSDALNKGFSSSAGEILAWLNSDDLYLPGTLKKVVDYFNAHPDCLWLYGNCRMIDEADREIRKWITAYKIRKSADFSFQRLLVENFISQPAVFFRRSAFEQAGAVDTSLPTAMDYDLWLRLAKLGKPGFINDFLASFRVHPGSISARNYRKQFEEQYQIHKKYDLNKLALLKHRLMILLIVSVYSLFNLYFCFKVWIWSIAKKNKLLVNSR